MEKNYEKNMENCKSKQIIELISQKWVLNILKHISDNGKKRFNELREEITGINPRTLSERLKELEEENILEKKKYNETPPKTEYELTIKGRELTKCFEKLDEWIEKHEENKN